MESSLTSLTPLTKFSKDFDRLINLDPFLIVLVSKGIILNDELEKFSDDSPRHSRSRQILQLLTVLSKKGKKGVTAVIESLEEEKTHAGHEELAEILRKEYCGGNYLLASYLAPKRTHPNPLSLKNACTVANQLAIYFIHKSHN